MAKKFENGRGTRGLEKSKAKRALRIETLLSVVRQTFSASEGEKWLTARHQVRENAEMPGRWTDGIAATRKAVFVLWAEPIVSFSKEINIISESNQVTKASVKPGKALFFTWLAQQIRESKGKTTHDDDRICAPFPLN